MAKRTKIIDKAAPYKDEANKGYKHLVKHCLDKYRTFKDSKYRAKKLDEIQNAVKVYAQEDQPTSEPWEGASNIQMPLTTITLDNLEPRMVSGLIGKRPYVRLEMENDQKQDDVTELLQTWFDNELEDVVDIEGMARATVHRVLQDGTVFVLPYYDLDEITRLDFVFESEIEQIIAEDTEFAQLAAKGVESGQWVFQNGLLMDLLTAEPVTREYQESIFEGGRYRIVPWNDVYIPDDLGTTEDWDKSIVIRKVYPTYSELVTDAKRKVGYVNVGPWLFDQTGGQQLRKDRATQSQASESVLEHGKDTIECIECSLSYIYVPDDTDEGDNTDLREERIVCQIALESEVLVRIVPLRKIYHKNRHLLRRIRMFPEEGKSYGTSMATKISALQKGASKTFNMAVNVAEIAMIPWFMYDSKTGLDTRYKDGIELKIGKGIPVDSVQGLYFPTFGVNPSQIFDFINLWVSFWERVSSIGDLQVGRQGDKDRTATETMAVIQEGNIKHNYQSTSIKEDFLEIVRTIYDLYYQHMPFNKTFLWKGQDVPVPRQAMRRMKSFRLTGSTEQSNKLIERQEKEAFYQISAQDPNINPIKRAEELVKAYGHTDTSEWVAPQIAMIVQGIMQIPNAPQVVTQVLQQMQIQMQAQQMTQQQLSKEEGQNADKMQRQG